MTAESAQGGYQAQPGERPGTPRSIPSEVRQSAPVRARDGHCLGPPLR